MTAGIKTLELLQRPGTYQYLDKVTKSLTEGLLKVARDAGHSVSGGYISAMFGMFFTGPMWLNSVVFTGECWKEAFI